MTRNNLRMQFPTVLLPVHSYIGEMMEKASDAKNFDELTKMVTTWRRM